MIPSETKKTTRSAGFSLIELLVSLAVITIVAGMFFVQRGAFSRSVALNNVSQEVALAIRETQGYGVSSRGSSIGDGINNFTYGINFNSSSPREFILYRETSGQNGYQSADTEIETYRLPGKMEIAHVCVNPSFGDTDCSSAGNLSIVFSRPHPNALFYNSSGVEISGETAVIVIEEPDSNNLRSIITRSSGFISTE